MDWQAIFPTAFVSRRSSSLALHCHHLPDIHYDMAPPPVIEHLSALENFKVARTYMKQLETVHTLSYKWRWQVTDSLFGRLSYGT